MVLIDDPDNTVIEPLFTKKFRTLYDLSLMMQSGHIRGYMIDDEKVLQETAGALARLADPHHFNKKYSVSGKKALVYALGDGNHSFAAAKAIWERMKKKAAGSGSIMSHPARYSLVELVNIHDPGVVFEPIHRVVFNVNLSSMLQAMQHFYRQQGAVCTGERYDSKEAAEHEALKLHGSSAHLICFVSSEGYGLLTVKNPVLNLEAATLQAFLDAYIKENSPARIDYIHGENVVTGLGTRQGNVGFYLPAISKHAFFKTIIVDGALPRKTFSMGEADEKRFYLECRRITA